MKVLLVILLVINSLCDLRSNRENDKMKEERVDACMKLSRARLDQDAVYLYIIVRNILVKF
jgi:hypothetical protein